MQQLKSHMCNGSPTATRRPALDCAVPTRSSSHITSLGSQGCRLPGAAALEAAMRVGKSLESWIQMRKLKRGASQPQEKKIYRTFS